MKPSAACVGVWQCVIWIVMSTGGAGVCMSLVQSDRYLCLSRFLLFPQSDPPTNQKKRQRDERERDGAHWFAPVVAMIVPS